MPYVVERGTRLITNAGGVNPVAAHQFAVAAARDAGFRGLRIGLVCAEMERPPDALGREVYLGAEGVARALADGADVVITGRVADAALFLAPMVFEHGWSWTDWDRLAAGVVVGHLLECSNQVAGGNYSGDWWNTVDLARVGMPVAEVAADGSAVITKSAGSSGRVSFDTVREQLLYEVHDPSAYVTPDVVADFTTVALEEIGPDRVRVSGARGRPRPATLKGLVFEHGGWAGECALTYAWPDAAAKGRHVLRSLRAVAEERKLPVLEWCEELFGVNGFGGPTVDVVATLAIRPRSPLGWRGEPPTPRRRGRCCSSSGCSRCPALPGCRASADHARVIRSASSSGSRRSSSTATRSTCTSTSRRCDALPVARRVRGPLRATRATSATSACSPTTAPPTTRSSPRSRPNESRPISARWCADPSSATSCRTSLRSSSCCTARSAAA